MLDPQMTSHISSPAESAISKPYLTEKRKEAVFGWMFLAPELIGMLVLTVFPMLFSLYLSFCNWNLVGGLSAIEFVGLENFRNLFDDSKFYLALKHNGFYTLFTVPLTMCIALLLAVLIHSKVYWKDYFKVVFFIPYISSIIAVSAVWNVLFHPSLGPINQLLMSLGLDNPPKWLASTQFSLTSVMIIMIWAGIGYQVIIFIAGLSNISDEYYEAAEIDGASSVRKFVNITLPLLTPTITFLLITSLIASFKIFDAIAFLTEGGPSDSSTVLVYRIYEEGFRNFRMGYASAISWILFLIVLVVTFITWNIQKRTTHY